MRNVIIMWILYFVLDVSTSSLFFISMLMNESASG